MPATMEAGAGRALETDAVVGESSEGEISGLAGGDTASKSMVRGIVAGSLVPTSVTMSATGADMCSGARD